MRSRVSNRVHRSPSGFILVEVIVCIVLATLSIIPITTTAILSNKLDNSARIAQLINTAVASKSSELHARDFNTLSVSVVDFSNELPQGIPSPKTATYTVSVRSGNPDIKDIAFTITYTNSGATVTNTFKTSVGNI